MEELLVKRFGVELIEALIPLEIRDLPKLVLKSLEEKSFILAAISQIISDAGIKNHSKCSKRRNVFMPHDILVAVLTNQREELSRTNNEYAACPFFENNECIRLKEQLTIPSACARRIAKENVGLADLKDKINKSAYFINRTINLLKGNVR